MQLRRFSEKGIAEFETFLKDDDPVDVRDIPKYMLDDDDLTDIVVPEVEIVRKEFKTRLEAAKYLYDRLENVQNIEQDIGIWSWLALFFFEELCKVVGDEFLKREKLYRYILDLIWRHYYRHLLAGPFYIYKYYRNNIEDAMILLFQPLNSPGDYVEQLASSQELVTNQAIIKTATMLYYDPETKSHKKGGQTPGKPGTLRRFLQIIKQLDLTYDLYGKNYDILKLLPPEFNRWKTNS